MTRNYKEEMFVLVIIDQLQMDRKGERSLLFVTDIIFTS